MANAATPLKSAAKGISADARPFDWEDPFFLDDQLKPYPDDQQWAYLAAVPRIDPATVELIARVRYHSKGYISLLERNAAFEALVESQRQLEVRNRFIRDTFGRYLSDEIVENLLERPGGLALGGEKRRVTIMMADLRGFTSLSERLPPEKVVKYAGNRVGENSVKDNATSPAGDAQAFCASDRVDDNNTISDDRQRP